MKGVNRFGVKRKLAPRYVGPYQIIERSSKVAYKVQLPPQKRAIFPVFHVSQLKCLRVPEERVEIGGLSCSQIYPMKRSLYKFLMSRKGLLE